MLYACAASFPRAAIANRLHDDWDGKLLTALCDPGSDIRNCSYHLDCFRQSLSKRCHVGPKAVSEPRGVLSAAPHVPVKVQLWSRHRAAVVTLSGPSFQAVNC